MKTKIDKIHILLTLVLLIVVLFLLFRGNPDGKGKIAFINISFLVSKYEGAKMLEQEIENQSKLWRANADTLISEFENQMKEFEKNRAKMTVREIKLTEELLRNKQNQIAQYQQVIKQRKDQEEMKLKEKMLKKIDEYIKEYGINNNYQFILGATGMGNLVYANETSDITEDIIKGLNQRYNSEKNTNK